MDVLLTELAANGIVLEPERSGKERRKRGDEHLWELLAAGTPATLVTGDQHLIDEPVGGATVMSARDFADMLKE